MHVVFFVVCKFVTCAILCFAACPLGQLSKVWVPRGTKVRLPDLTMESSNDQDCHVACHCSSRGKIDNCKRLSCSNRTSCDVGRGHIKGLESFFLYFFFQIFTIFVGPESQIHEFYRKRTSHSSQVSQGSFDDSTDGLCVNFWS